VVGRPPAVRVGLLVPSSNTVMEVDFYRRLPPHVTLHTARMYMESTTPEGEALMLDQHVMPAARDIATVRPDVVVFGCTSAGALRGVDYERNLCDRIGDQTGATVVSVISAVRDALRSRSAARVGVITPYVDDLNDRIRASLEEDGVDVPIIRGLNITENFSIALVPPEEIVSFAVRALAGSSVDLVFVSCTNFRALDAKAMIEARLGLPVITSNSAALEAALAVVNRSASSAERA
jgi:maleate isomerase